MALASNSKDRRIISHSRSVLARIRSIFRSICSSHSQVVCCHKAPPGQSGRLTHVKFLGLPDHSPGFVWGHEAAFRLLPQTVTDLSVPARFLDLENAGWGRCGPLWKHSSLWRRSSERSRGRPAGWVPYSSGVFPPRAGCCGRLRAGFTISPCAVCMTFEISASAIHICTRRITAVQSMLENSFRNAFGATCRVKQ